LNPEEAPLVPDTPATLSPQSDNRQIARAAGTVMVAIIIGNLVGLARSILVLQTFDTSAELDAFYAANRVSETLFNLVAGGALGSAFIPTFTTLLTRGDRRGAWQLASAMANLILLILTIAAVLAAIFAPQIVRYGLAPGFSANPEQEALAISLLRLLLPSAVIFGLSGLVMGILNSHQVFLIPALTPSMYGLGMIFGVVVLAPNLGIYGLAWGAVIGALMHLALQIPALLKRGGQYQLILGLEMPAVREVLRLMAPRLFGVAVVQLNFWVNALLASFQPEGSYSAIVTAFMLMLMPQAAIAQSIAIAALPTFSVQFARGKLDEMRASLAASLRGVLLLSAPASLGLILLRRPLVAVLYERGEFTAQSTDLVAWALLWYAAGLVGHSVVEILARAFYSMHDTKTPVLVGAAAMGLNVAFSVAFSALFARVGWMPHGGLALANSLATGLEMAGLLALMRRRLNGLDGRRVLQGAGQAGLAALVMGIGLWAWISQADLQPAWLVAGVGVALGGGLYGISMLALGVREVRGVVRRIFP
jgi:putative peptidoglycan lipid II flippase